MKIDHLIQEVVICLFGTIRVVFESQNSEQNVIRRLSKTNSLKEYFKIFGLSSMNFVTVPQVRDI